MDIAKELKMLEEFEKKGTLEEWVITYQLDNQYMCMVFDTKDKQNLLERFTQEVSDYLHSSIDYLQSLINHETSPEAISLIEMKEKDISPHSFYTAFVALWKTENTDEDFIEILNDLIEEWKVSRLEWVEHLHLTLDDYEEYVLRDKRILKSMFSDYFDSSI